MKTILDHNSQTIWFFLSTASRDSGHPCSWRGHGAESNQRLISWLLPNFSIPFPRWTWTNGHFEARRFETTWYHKPIYALEWWKIPHRSESDSLLFSHLEKIWCCIYNLGLGTLYASIDVSSINRSIASLLFLDHSTKPNLENSVVCFLVFNARSEV